MAAKKIEIKRNREGDYLEFIDGPHRGSIIFDKGRFIFSAPIETFREKS